MTRIITTLGPASAKEEILSFFADHSVEIGRLNFSHGSIETHRELGKLAQQFDLDLLFDLPGPKLRLGDLSQNVQIPSGRNVAIELAKEGIVYPITVKYNQEDCLVLSCAFDIAQFAEPGADILVDDGKLHLQVLEVNQDRVYTNVVFGGLFKPRKSLNMPGTAIDLPFMGDRDKLMLRALLPELKPKFVAPSFVKTVQEVMELKSFIMGILNQNQITGYFPLICTKVEMAEAVSDQNLSAIVKASDMIMIARGDLALETKPLHLSVPFLQEKIKQECRAQGKPFVVATQILESMTDNPAPTRAEISDLYRAVVIDQADYIMLSGETATGQFPTICVNLMHSMINYKDIQTTLNPKKVAGQEVVSYQIQSIQ